MSLNITEVTDEQDALQCYEEVISEKPVIVRHYIRGDKYLGAIDSYLYAN